MTDGVVGSRFKVGAWVVTEDRNTAFDGSAEVDNPMQERTRIRVPLLTLDVRLTDRFGVQAAATVPDITRTAIVPRPTGPFSFRENFSGIGDTSVLGWYRLRPVHRWFIVVNAGASLPTGRTERPRFRPELEGGSLVPMSRLQRGSGTIDPLFGLNASRRFGVVTAFASLAARAPVADNDDGLRTGVSSELSGGAAREIGNHRVMGFTRVSWVHREQDAFNGTPVLVGGGDWVYATPGVGVLVGKGINIQAEVKLPVYRSLANKQLDSAAIFQLGISRAF